MILKSLPVLLVLIALTFGLASCPAPAVPEPVDPTIEEPVVEETSLVVLQTVDANSLDPFFINQIPELNILLAVFDSLLAWDDEGNIVPNVATHWELVDELTWEFTIRQGIEFHNGEELTAHDVVYTLERALDPDVGAIGWVPWRVSNMKLDRVELVDDWTFRIISSEPNPYLLSFAVEWLILPKEHYETTPLEVLAREPVGSGPYKFVEWRRGERLHLQANPTYWDGEPEISEVVWRPVPEASARIAELNTDSADIVVNVPPDLVDQIDLDYGEAVTVQGLRRIYIGFVFYGHTAIHDKRVRQAINYGIDFQKIIDSLLDGNGERTGTFVNPPFQNPHVEPYPYDPEKALELLAEAGYEDRSGDGMLEDPDGMPLVLTLQTPSGRFIKDSELAQAVAAELREIGINVEVDITEWSAFAGQLPAGQLTGDLFFMGAGTALNCPGDLSDFYSGSGWDPGRWQNSEFDALIEELLATFDEERAMELCYEAQEFMHEEAPIIFLYFQVDYYGVSNRVDWQPAPNERIYVYQASFKD